MQTIKEKKESHKEIRITHCCTETTGNGSEGGDGGGAQQLTTHKLVIWCNQKGITAERGTQVSMAIWNNN